MRSKWVKLRPWYYTERRQPTRAAEMSEALSHEDDRSEEDPMASRRAQASCRRRGYRARTRNAAVIQQGSGGSGGDSGGKAQQAVKATKARKA